MVTKTVACSADIITFIVWPISMQSYAFSMYASSAIAHACSIAGDREASPPHSIMHQILE